MTARDLLDALRRADLSIAYDFDRRTFEVTPAGRLTPEDIEEIRSVRDGLRELLIAEHLEGLGEQLYDPPREPAAVPTRAPKRRRK